MIILAMQLSKMVVVGKVDLEVLAVQIFQIYLKTSLVILVEVEEEVLEEEVLITEVQI